MEAPLSLASLNPLLLGAVMAALGNATHILKRVVEARAGGEEIGLIAYIRANPYRVVLGVIGTAAVLGLLIELDRVSTVGAFAAGYMADSGLSILSARAKRGLS